MSSVVFIQSPLPEICFSGNPEKHTQEPAAGIPLPLSTPPSPAPLPWTAAARCRFPARAARCRDHPPSALNSPLTKRPPSLGLRQPAAAFPPGQPAAGSTPLPLSTPPHQPPSPWTAAARCRFPARAARCRDHPPSALNSPLTKRPPPSPRFVVPPPGGPLSPLTSAHRPLTPPYFCPPFFCQSPTNKQQPSGARQPAKGCPQGEVGGPRRTANSEQQPSGARQPAKGCPQGEVGGPRQTANREQRTANKNPYPNIRASRFANSRSASTMIFTNSLKVTFGTQPSCFFAFAGSPMSSSTSAGRS
jgi:hypothetical protein